MAVFFLGLLRVQIDPQGWKTVRYLTDVACIFLDAVAPQGSPFHAEEQESRKHDGETQSQKIENSRATDDCESLLFIIPALEGMLQQCRFVALHN